LAFIFFKQRLLDARVNKSLVHQDSGAAGPIPPVLAPPPVLVRPRELGPGELEEEGCGMFFCPEGRIESRDQSGGWRENSR